MLRASNRLAPVLGLALLLAGCGSIRTGTPTSAGSAGAPREAAETETSTVTNTANGTTLTVFAGASLVEAFDAIGKTFEARHPGVTVTFNYAGSNQLAQQIRQGAPADVFASANSRQMDVVQQLIDGTPRVFVRNRLVVIYPPENRAKVRTLQDLANRGVKLVLAATEVPAGQYALDFLDKTAQDRTLGEFYREAVLKNVVSYEENVRAVLSKVSLGEADAGIVYTSDISAGAAGTIGQIDIPDGLNTIATYPIVPIKGSKNLELAQRFVQYILSPEAQAVLGKHGFLPVAETGGGD